MSSRQEIESVSALAETKHGNPPPANGDSESLEKNELVSHASRVDTDKAASLSQQHREYLLQRHGTLDLDPVPGLGGADPYNWPTWKVLHSSFSSPYISTQLFGSCRRKPQTLSLSPSTPACPPSLQHLLSQPTRTSPRTLALASSGRPISHLSRLQFSAGPLCSGDPYRTASAVVLSSSYQPFVVYLAMLAAQKVQIMRRWLRAGQLWPSLSRPPPPLEAPS